MTEVLIGPLKLGDRQTNTKKQQLTKAETHQQTSP